MGPGVFKTQSKHTKTKSRYRTGMKEHKESKPFRSYWMKVEENKEWLPVSWLLLKFKWFKFANWTNLAGMGPGVYKTQSKHTKNKSPYPTGMKGHKESKPFGSYWMQVKGKRIDYWKVGCYITTAALILPIGPIQPEWNLGYTKPSQNIQKTRHTIRLVWKGIRKASLFGSKDDNR